MSLWMGYGQIVYFLTLKRFRLSRACCCCCCCRLPCGILREGCFFKATDSGNQVLNLHGDVLREFSMIVVSTRSIRPECGCGQQLLDEGLLLLLMTRQCVQRLSPAEVRLHVFLPEGLRRRASRWASW